MKLIRLLALLLAAMPAPALAEVVNSSSKLPQQVASGPELQFINCSLTEEEPTKLSCFLNGEEPIKLPESPVSLKPKRIQSPRVERSQQLPSDKLINQQFRFGNLNSR